MKKSVQGKKKNWLFLKQVVRTWSKEGILGNWLISIITSHPFDGVVAILTRYVRRADEGTNWTLYCHINSRQDWKVNQSIYILKILSLISHDPFFSILGILGKPFVIDLAAACLWFPWLDIEYFFRLDLWVDDRKNNISSNPRQPSRLPHFSDGWKWTWAKVEGKRELNVADKIRTSELSC